jgi:poly(hydroxyalkanoate) depolymerase family esterase
MLHRSKIPIDMNRDFISQTIQRALTAAGLHPRPPWAQGLGTRVREAADAVLVDAEVAAQRTAPIEENIQATKPPGQFMDREFVNAAGSRRYKLFVPNVAHVKPMPLLVMLHGCKQNPDDFAAGTRMNALAQAQGFMVAYPAQTVAANGSNCWNWFRARDQAREGGEAHIIAGMALQVAAEHDVDRRRIFVAGLSAGAAMAVILGARYPEVFSAVGAHSGLPFGAAHDVASAFAAMSRQGPAWPQARAELPQSGCVGVPTIVFHGDGDATVAARNGWLVVEQARAAFAAQGLNLQMQIEEGTAPAGSTFTTSRFTDDQGSCSIEHWLLHGGSHAWSGGSPEGSYTSSGGPDASAEMLRFFLAQ